MDTKGVDVNLVYNTPGFTLPTNIGELGDDITQLDLDDCSLTGARSYKVITCVILLLTVSLSFAGELPKEVGKLVNLEVFNVGGNSIGGELYVPSYMCCNVR